MYSQQSQTPSTRLAPFDASFKKALRLNRDQFGFRQVDRIPMNPWSRKENQLQYP